MVDLLVLTSLDQLLFKTETNFSFFYKTTYLNEEVNSTEPSPSSKSYLVRSTMFCQDRQEPILKCS
jgi:hypothetical protein